MVKVFFWRALWFLFYPFLRLGDWCKMRWRRKHWGIESRCPLCGDEDVNSDLGSCDACYVGAVNDRFCGEGLGDVA